MGGSHEVSTLLGERVKARAKDLLLGREASILLNCTLCHRYDLDVAVEGGKFQNTENPNAKAAVHNMEVSLSLMYYVEGQGRSYPGIVFETIVFERWNEG